MLPDTMSISSTQPFGVVLKRVIVQLINAADDPMEREDRIQIALEEGAITYAESYQLRTDGDLEIS
jgi:hypothetical protein